MQLIPILPLVAAVTITSIHYIFPPGDGQAELACVAWLNMNSHSYGNKSSMLMFTGAIAQIFILCLTGLVFS